MQEHEVRLEDETDGSLNKKKGGRKKEEMKIDAV